MASSIHPFMLPSLSSFNPSQRPSLFHLRSAVPQSQNLGLKASRLLRQDGNCIRVMASGNLSYAVTQENVLNWVKQDNRRMLHVVYRAGDLDRTIKFL